MNRKYVCMYVYLPVVISEHSSELKLGQLLQHLFSVPLVIIRLSFQTFSSSYSHNSPVSYSAQISIKCLVSSTLG